MLQLFAQLNRINSLSKKKNMLMIVIGHCVLHLYDVVQNSLTIKMFQ